MSKLSEQIQTIQQEIGSGGDDYSQIVQDYLHDVRCEVEALLDSSRRNTGKTPSDIRRMVGDKIKDLAASGQVDIGLWRIYRDNAEEKQAGGYSVSRFSENEDGSIAEHRITTEDATLEDCDSLRQLLDLLRVR
mgnify:CR=1 FL=1